MKNNQFEEIITKLSNIMAVLDTVIPSISAEIPTPPPLRDTGYGSGLPFSKWGRRCQIDALSSKGQVEAKPLPPRCKPGGALFLLNKYRNMKSKMKANEFRIGNLVQTQNGYYYVAKISENGIELIRDGDGMCEPYIEGMTSPVVITETLLFWCGFKKINNEMKCGGFIMEKFHDGYHYTMGEGCMDGVPILYLHQLQNIHFAITGEELQICL